MIAELDFFLKYNELNDLLLQCVAGLNNLRFRDFFFFLLIILPLKQVLQDCTHKIQGIDKFKSKVTNATEI